MVQVDVATHFNEDGFTFGLAHGLADRLREALRDVRCDEHHGQPDAEQRVRVSTQGIAQTLNDLHVEVTGCCTAVVERIQETVQRIRDETGS